MADEETTATADAETDDSTTQTPTSESSPENANAEGAAEGTTAGGEKPPVTEAESAGHLRRRLIKAEKAKEAAEAALRAKEAELASGKPAANANPYAMDQDLQTLVETKVNEGVSKAVQTVEERLAEQRKQDAMERKADAEEKALKAKFPELWKKYSQKIEELYASNPQAAFFPKWVFDQVVPEPEQDAAIAARAIKSRQTAEDKIADRPRPPSAQSVASSGSGHEGSTIGKDEFLSWSTQMAQDDFGV